MDPTLKEAILAFDRPVPRYTSYPTAPHFQAIQDDSVYRSWLQDIAPNARLSLYLHIPFCPKLCWFCGCTTKITQRYSPVEDYLHLLIREIEILGDLCGSSRTVQNIHFGGGSPTMLASSDFALLMDRLRETFSVFQDASVSIEIDPRNLTSEKAETYAKSGITRASLGVQDFDQTVMEAINRPQPFAMVYDAVALLRANGISQINLDMMYGLPHQTIDTMRRAAEYALLMNPERIALFGYAHVPWMKKHMRLMPEHALPPPSDRIDLFDAASGVFTQAGYVQIGIDHFAKSSDPLAQAHRDNAITRNFQGYTDDSETALLGLGASAISHLPQGFAQNSPHMPLYREKILAGTLPIEKMKSLNAEDRLRSAIIADIMCTLKADLSTLCREHGFASNHLNTAIESLKQLESAGLIALNGNSCIRVLDRYGARLACAAFDSYLRPIEHQRHVTIT